MWRLNLHPHERLLDLNEMNRQFCKVKPQHSTMNSSRRWYCMKDLGLIVIPMRQILFIRCRVRRMLSQRSPLCWRAGKINYSLAPVLTLNIISIGNVIPSDGSKNVTWKVTRRLKKLWALFNDVWLRLRLINYWSSAHTQSTPTDSDIHLSAHN